MLFDKKQPARTATNIASLKISQSYKTLYGISSITYCEDILVVSLLQHSLYIYTIHNKIHHGCTYQKDTLRQTICKWCRLLLLISIRSANKLYRHSRPNTCFSYFLITIDRISALFIKINKKHSFFQITYKDLICKRLR